MITIFANFIVKMYCNLLLDKIDEIGDSDAIIECLQRIPTNEA